MNPIIHSALIIPIILSCLTCEKPEHDNPFDPNNPDNPKIIGSCDTPGYAEGVAVAGGCAFVADWDSGL